MRDRLPFNDLVVVLPGIGGSVLRSPDGPLWEPSLGMAGSLLRNRRDVLDRLADDRLDDPEYTPGVTATGLISTPVTIPGLASLNQYEPLRRALATAFELTAATSDGAPANYFEFAYDWRRDNRISAAALKRLVDCERPKWESMLPYGEAKTVLVCHSMGGLVAKYYLDVLGGWRHCRALITYGTPFRGSVKALSLLANGIGVFGLELTAVSELIRSYTSVYQLLPRYPVVRDDGVTRRVGELVRDVGGLDVRRARAAYDFHRQMQTPPGCRLMPIVGHGHRTFQSATLTSAGLTVTNDLIDLGKRAFDSGDGTVPSISALPVELSEIGPRGWQNGKHSSMHTDKDALASLVKDLALFSAGLRDLQHPDEKSVKHAPTAEGTTLDLRVEEVHAAGEPVRVECVLSDASVTEPPRLTISGAGQVERTETGEGFAFTATGLRPGAHEVSVDWAGCSVTDIFEVS